MTPSMSCVRFCIRVLGLRLTNGQRAFVAVAIDRILPRDLEGAVREAALTMFGDVDAVPAVAWRTVVACFGRDSGKTELAASIALYKLLTIDISRAGPGDVPTAAIVAPTMRTAKILLRRALARVNAVPELARLIEVSTQTAFMLRRPHDQRLVAFEVFAASRGGSSLRGLTFVVLMMDEAALFRDATASEVNDSAIYDAAMPRVLPNGLVLFLSTPWTEEGLFYKLANENMGAPVTAIAARASTVVMRDHAAEYVAQVEAERQRDPDNAAREFDALFMVGGSSLFFDADSITDAIDDDRAGAPLQDGEDVACGADVGLVRDSSALAVVASLRDQLRLIEHLELRPTKKEPLKLSGTVATFAEVCKRHRVSSFTADQHVRGPAREFAEKHGLDIDDAPAGRGAIFDSHVVLRKAFNERRIYIPRAPRLLAQLRAVQSRPMPGGGFQISTPRRAGIAHGDIVSALVLGVHAVNGNGAVDYEAALRDLPGGMF